MNRFAELLDRLAYEPGRNNKLRLITAYFRDTPDPDRGYALAALTGALSFKHAKPGLIRDLITDRTDPVLFGLSYDYVGDLSETVALMWPKSLLPSPRAVLGEGSGVGGGAVNAEAAVLADSPPTPNPSPPRAMRVEGGRSAACRATTTLPRRRFPKSSPRCARSARPSCRSSSRAGSMSSTKPAAGRC